MVGWPATNGWRFDVSNRAHQRIFKGFIEFVRSNLGVDGTVMQQARKLPPQQVIPVFQDLQLLAGPDPTTVVTLRLRTDNLYVVGFRNTNGQWFKFLGDGTIAGSTMLRFSGGYVGGGLGTLASVTDINVESWATMGDAVRGLAGYGGGAGISDDKLKVWLRRLIVIFIESSRFTGMADCVAAAALSGSEQEKKDMRFTTSLVEQIHNWSSLSKALLHAANDVSLSNDGRIHFADFGKCNIHNAYEAAAALGLVLHS